MKKILNVIEQDREAMTQEVKKLEHALTHFRYEGKLQRGKNWKAIRNIVSSLRQELQRHQRYQEKVLFPFLGTHVPKYESTIHFLQSDHQEIQKNTQKIKKSLKFLRHSGNRSFDGELQETGVYLVCLVRHHMELEKKSIHKALRKELKRNERLEIGSKMRKWLGRHKDGWRE